MLIGTVVSLPFLDVGWMIGLPVGFVSYLLLTRATLDRRVTTYLSADREPTSASEAD
jgi:NCS1 family nucleobase:cation symporter-1